MNSNKIQKKYIVNVKKNLKCFKRSKNACIDSLKQIISEQDQTGLTDYNSFVSYFGDPKQVAENYMQEIDKEETIKFSRIRRLTIITATIGLIVALILCVYFIMLTKDTVVFSYEHLPSSPSNIEPFKTDEFGNPLP